ncbi:PAQR family membrane homeostasis protein TrhA [Corallibacter sp.]|uniref:PAQR family membrane homeostasis protein TrhA n=1 Tax=Corallibacter sp. TaxID=2038084 RepID=UPI003AB72ECA
MRIQTPFEERLNTATHAIGAIFGVVALVLLIMYNTHKTPHSVFSVAVYGATIIILFLSSTLYHAVSNQKQKHYFRILDHVSIYLLIAGTYTPVSLIALEQSNGWVLFYTVWAIAAFGLILKLFFTGKYEAFSVVLYLAMGWLVVFDYTYLAQILGANGLFYLFAGGFFYTIGIVFYAIERIPYNHVIWHLFVLAGAVSHFFMTLWYVI